MLDVCSPLLQVFHIRESNSGEFNRGGRSFPELDSLVQQPGTELDVEKRLALETVALTTVKDKIIMIPQYRHPTLRAIIDEVKMIPPLPDNKAHLKYAKM